MLLRKFKNIIGSASNTYDPCLLSSDEYVALLGDINSRDEFADDRIRDKVAKKSNKVLVLVPLLCSWINFLVDIIYSLVEYSANGTFILMLTSFSTVLPKRGLAHAIILDVDPNFERRSKALAVASAVAASLLCGSAFFRVLGLLNIPNLTISMVFHIAIAFIQMGITTIT